MTGPSNESHEIVLVSTEVDGYWDYANQRHVSSSIIVQVTHTRRNGSGVVEVNESLSLTSFGEYSGASYYLTAFLNATTWLHVFWERTQTAEDVPKQYWIFHEGIGVDGEVLPSRIIYFETRGVTMPGPSIDPLWLIAPIGLSLLAATLLWRWRRSRPR